MLNFLLAPASWLYKMAVLFRHQLFDWGVLRSEKFDIPIICIGNITVGGTGKTPLAEMIVDYMSQRHCVALLSRGYGRRTEGYREVQPLDHYRDVGDEPLQIKRKFPQTVVAVCERRADGIRRIRTDHPEVDLIVMDDGFQHRYVEAKINIVLIDATRPVQEDRMLPLGTLRDVPAQLHRANYFIVTKCPDDMSPLDRRILRKVLIEAAYQSIYFTRMEAFRPQPVFEEAPADADIVVGVPDSSLSAAMGYAEASGLPYEMGLVKNKYIGRTFIQPSQELRDRGVRMKLSPVKSVVGGKRVVLIDDSVVRGTTSKRIVGMLRDAGATEVHLRIASPQITRPCFYGIDISTYEELLCAHKTLDEVRDILGVDSIAFLSEKALFEAGHRSELCLACFNGSYPTYLYQSLEEANKDGKF